MLHCNFKDDVLCTNTLESNELLCVCARITFICLINTSKTFMRARQASTINLINILFIKIKTSLTIEAIVLKLACQTIRWTYLTFILNEKIACLTYGAFTWFSLTLYAFLLYIAFLANRCVEIEVKSDWAYCAVRILIARDIGSTGHILR